MTSQFSSHFRKRLHYVGNLGARDLRELYCAADLFASLSLHHDEDYGMSPAEALCCGLPAVLTDWGGFASFKRDEDSCHLVPVRIGNSGPEVAASSFFDYIERIRSARGELSRELRSQFFQSRISIQGAREILRNIHAAPLPLFRGFSDLMLKYGNIFKAGLLYNDSREHFNLYREIYGNYTKEQMGQGQNRASRKGEGARQKARGVRT